MYRSFSVSPEKFPNYNIVNMSYHTADKSPVPGQVGLQINVLLYEDSDRVKSNCFRFGFVSSRFSILWLGFELNKFLIKMSIALFQMKNLYTLKCY